MASRIGSCLFAVAGLIFSRFTNDVASAGMTSNKQVLFQMDEELSFFHPFAMDKSERGLMVKNNSSIDSWLFDPDWLILEKSLCSDEVTQFESCDDAFENSSCFFGKSTSGSLTKQFQSEEDESNYDLEDKASYLYDPSWFMFEDVSSEISS